MNPAARTREHKQVHPEQYCHERACLWRVLHRDGSVTPCPRHEATLCRRTVCLHKPGVPLPGVRCSFRYNGRMPCTGRLVCHTCGRSPNPNEGS